MGTHPCAHCSDCAGSALEAQRDESTFRDSCLSVLVRHSRPPRCGVVGAWGWATGGAPLRQRRPEKAPIHRLLTGASSHTGSSLQITSGTEPVRLGLRFNLHRHGSGCAATRRPAPISAMFLVKFTISFIRCCPSRSFQNAWICGDTPSKNVVISPAPTLGCAPVRMLDYLQEPGVPKPRLRDQARGHLCCACTPRAPFD